MTEILNDPWVLTAKHCRNPAEIIATFSVTVDYTKTLEQMANASGLKIHPDINAKHYRVRRKGSKPEVEIGLLRFSQPVVSRRALRWIDRFGYRPATLPEALKLNGDDLKVILEDYSQVLILGSLWKPKIYQPKLTTIMLGPKTRMLRPIGFNRRWLKGCYFAVVRKDV